MPIRQTRPIYAAAILERPDHHHLIVRTAAVREEERVWMFPRGRVQANESPEAAMRRIAKSDLGISVDILVGQPPFLVRQNGDEVEMRYFYCAIEEGSPRLGPYEEMRWVSKPHLREYDFDGASEPVAQWLLEQ
jgi:ADP-ribose pyrophosphatase YjhB (NUDIX family)